MSLRDLSYDTIKNMEQFENPLKIPITTILEPSNILKNFEILEEGKFYELSRFPIKKEAIEFTGVNREVIVVKSRNGKSFFAKGISVDEIGIKPEEIIALDPDLIAHTHIPDVSDKARQGEIQKIREGIPSPDDLNGRELGANKYYIWTRFGRIIYKPIEGKLTGHSKQIIRNGLEHAQLEAIKLKPLNAKEAINFMSQTMETLGCNFSFSEWKDISIIDN
jgi:hypothetical protein